MGLGGVGEWGPGSVREQNIIAAGNGVESTWKRISLITGPYPSLGASLHRGWTQPCLQVWLEQSINSFGSFEFS